MMKELPNIANIEEKIPIIIKTLTGMLEDIDELKTGALDEKQRRQLTLVKTKGINILAMLGVTSLVTPATEFANNVSLLIEKLKLLKDACVSFKANEAKKILVSVKGIFIDEHIAAALTVIVQQINELDYDKAAARIGMLLSVLTGYNSPEKK